VNEGLGEDELIWQAETMPETGKGQKIESNKTLIVREAHYWELI